MKKTIITYEMYDHMLDKLINRIEFSKLYTKVKYVYGPPRGGLPIAVHLAHHLGLEFVTPLMTCQWLALDLKKVLIVDDVADTGKTLYDLKNFYETDFITATLHYKPRSIIKPDFYIEETTKWCCYPWEKINEKPNRHEHP